MKDAVFALLTVLASGVTAAVVSHFLAAKQEERRVIRQKLEELHASVHGFARGVSVFAIPMLHAMHGKCEYNEALDEQVKSGKDQDRDSYPKAQRLVGIYFPDLHAPWKQMLDSRDQLNRIQQEFKRDYMAGRTDGGPWAAEFRKELCGFDELSESMKTRIAEHRIAFGKRCPTKPSRATSGSAPSAAPEAPEG